MEELADENFILFNEDFYLNDKIIENAKNAGFVPNMASQISQWNVIENLVINQLGISILPATIAQLLNDDVKLYIWKMHIQLGSLVSFGKKINV